MTSVKFCRCSIGFSEPRFIAAACERQATSNNERHRLSKKSLLHYATLQTILLRYRLHTPTSSRTLVWIDGVRRKEFVPRSTKEGQPRKLGSRLAQPSRLF